MSETIGGDEPDEDQRYGAPVNLEIDGHKQVRYIFVANEDRMIGRIGVEFSYGRGKIPNGVPLCVRVSGKFSGTYKFEEHRIDPDYEMAACIRQGYPWRGEIDSAYRFVTVKPFLMGSGEQLVMSLSAAEGGAYQVWLRDARPMIVAKGVPFAKMESSINGGGSWEHVGYRDLNSCGFVLLPGEAKP